MSEPKPPSVRQQNTYTLGFMVILSLICAIILSILASALRVPQEMAKELDRSKQMLIAARILNPFGYFQIQNDQGEYLPAKVVEGDKLESAERTIIPTQSQVLSIYRNRIEGFLVDSKGDATTFEKAGIDEQKYVQDFRKSGYYKEPLKLIYRIFANQTENAANHAQERKIVGYVIPVNGMGLWDAIYGYLAIEPDADTVIGISWYDQKETPGLGANITEPEWQSQFPDKKVFLESADGKTDFNTAPLGITVVKGKVKEILGDSPKSLSAVDGMAGATLTGNGVTDAYRDVLAAYRPFLIKLHKENETSSGINKKGIL